MALSHLVLHLALCNAALRLKTQSELAVHVTVTDRIGRDVVDQTTHAYRDNGDEVPVELDVPWGIFRAKVKATAGRVTCGTTAYFAVLQDHNRTLDVSLRQGGPPPPVPTLIMGTAPFAFSYVEPTVVAFSGAQACDAPVGDPIDAGIATLNDADGYYADVVPSAALMQHGPPVIAVRLTDSHGGYHYIRMPAKALNYSDTWPSAAQFDVNEDSIDWVAGKPEDTLLCPKIYGTMVH